MDTGAGVSSLAVVVKAGPRNETHDNLGVNHAIRAAAGRSLHLYFLYVVLTFGSL